MEQAQTDITSALPRVPHRLIGRERERAAARDALLERAAPLLTLTGPGGVGKTRLALAIGSEVGDRFRDGVVWVDLAAISDPTHVPANLAEALRLTLPAVGEIEDYLARLLRPRQLLLLLDNCEHLLATVAPLVSALLTRCPALQVLATSRAPLRLRWEQILPVPPLPTPVADETLETIAGNEAIRLFVERARAVQPDFTLTATNKEAVARLCQQLDGLPLAIELAAARSAVLTPEAMVAQMRDRLRLLVSGPRDVPPRHETIAATIAWSYDLLDAESQWLFRRLAVFLGGFTLEAVAEVAGERGESEGERGKGGLGERSDGDANCRSMAPAANVTSPVPHPSSPPFPPSPFPSAIERLTSLIEHSLVQPMTAAGEPRYTMLETVRAFGLERLAESGEMEAARTAQAKALLAVALRRFRFKPGGQVQDEGRHPWLTAEQANVRATLTWLAETGNAEDALRLTAALSFSWHFQMTLRESQQWFEWVLANTPDRPSNARSLALGGLAMTMWAQGDLERAQQLATQALAIGERLDDEVAIADAVDTLGNIALTRHDYERAKPLMERAVSLWRHLGRPAAEASALQILAGIEHGLGEEDAALLHAQDALARFRLLQSPPGMAGSLARLARQVRDQGYDRTAALTYREQLVICFKWNDRFSIVQAFAGLGEIGGRHGQPEIAALLIGAIDAIAAAAGSKRLPTAGVNYDRATATARTALGEQEFASLRAAGRGLSVERAVSLAWQVNVPAAVPGEPAAPWLEPEVASGLPTATGFSHVPSDNRSASPVDLNLMLSQPEATPDLTYRERDVLGLLCQRWTDQEIASHLFISPRTVSSHVSNILAKLGAANRREAAAIAARSGLLQV